MKSQAKPKQRRYRTQGDLLRAARGDRTSEQIRVALDLKNVQQYQNWELGYNRPDVSKWALINTVLGVDAYALYGGLKVGPQKRTERDQMIKAAAIRPLVANIRKNIALLEQMVSPAAADAAVVDAGFDSRSKLKRAAKM